MGLQLLWRGTNEQGNLDQNVTWPVTDAKSNDVELLPLLSLRVVTHIKRLLPPCYHAWAQLTFSSPSREL